MTNSSNAKPKFEHLWGLGSDSFTEDGRVKNRPEQSEPSRAERDDPEGVREICEEVAESLDKWTPDLECENAEEFMFDLVDYLEENIGWEVEVQPDTPHGKPNILLGDKLALELKINPDKGERVRVAGQCADYSKQWVTWVILIGASSSTAGQLANLLTDKGLGRVLVWNFS